jgi:hypothetical protein
MSMLANFSSFVNEQVSVQTRLAAKYSRDEKRQALHLGSARKFQELAEAVTQADKLLDDSAPRTQVQTPVLTLKPDELEGLPSELLNELSDGAVPDKAELVLFQVIDERGGIASLDQILVGLYRKSGELMKRNTLTSKLYRMAQKGQIFTVPEKKGVYSTRKLSEEDAARLFGAEIGESPQQTLV